MTSEETLRAKIEEHIAELEKRHSMMKAELELHKARFCELTTEEQKQMSITRCIEVENQKKIIGEEIGYLRVLLY